MIHIYTDASASEKYELSGYGIVYCIGKCRAVLSGCTPLEDTCRTELLAAVIALQQLPKPSCVTVWSDSLYVVKGGRGNGDLWYTLDQLKKKHEIKICHVKGHNGHKLNELAHRLARRATDGLFENTLWWRDRLSV